MKKYLLFLALSLLLHTNIFGQAQDEMMPKIIEQNGRHALLVDGKPFIIMGGQAHNSSAWPGILPQLWQAVEQLHANTLEVPIYWEQIEAAQNKFDFSMIDTLLFQARQRNVRLVLLWFATWKNGSNHYMPEWMKKDATKYPNITGKDGKPVDSPSPHTLAAMEADTKAFTAVMRHLKINDTQHTVIMVQVENEPGAWGSVRDYSAAAQKVFESPVPPELLKPALLKALNVAAITKGNWQTVFGSNADEYFQAWSVARYIGQVAAAGKAEYALPMYVNAALRDPITNPKANTYESGGATDNVLLIWKAAAPAIDLLAPDIYLSGSEKVLKVIDLYDQKYNPLFVPEAGLNADNAKYLYDIIARGGIGFSPFGIDDNGQGLTALQTAEKLQPFAQEYAMATPMMRELAKWSFEGKISAVVEHEDHQDQTINLGTWQAIVSFGKGRGDIQPADTLPLGKLMIVRLAKNNFLLIGTRCRITFKPAGSNLGKAWQYNRVEEGKFENGVFQILRNRNGDETDFGGPRFGASPVILQTSLMVR